MGAEGGGSRRPIVLDRVGGPMKPVSRTLLVATAVFALIWAGWRLSSRRTAIPCPSWLGWLVELDNPFTRTNRAAVIIELLDLKPGMTVLDVGCGPGRLTIPVAERVGPAGQVVAVDMQPEMLRRAETKARQAGLGNVRFLAATAGGGELGSLDADRALLVTVLGEAPDREAVLKEVFAALKPGGVLSVTEVVFDPHFQSQRAVRSLAMAAGFREVAVFGRRHAYTLHLQKPAVE